MKALLKKIFNTLYPASDNFGHDERIFHVMILFGFTGSAFCSYFEFNMIFSFSLCFLYIIPLYVRLWKEDRNYGKN
jgi:hypothetical protein